MVLSEEDKKKFRKVIGAMPFAASLSPSGVNTTDDLLKFMEALSERLADHAERHNHLEEHHNDLVASLMSAGDVLRFALRMD